MIPAWVRALPWLFATGLIACGGGAAPDSPDSQVQAASAYAKVFCARLRECEPSYVDQAYGDTATCEARSAIAPLARLRAAGTGETVATLESCTSAQQAASCDRVTSHRLEACVEPILGQLADGAACAFAAQCKSAYCRRAGACGACTAPPAEGDSCATFPCATDLICDPVGFVCRRALVGPGERCDEATSCAPALSCVFPTGEREGSCQAKLVSEGATCDRNRVTAPTCYAEAGYVCTRQHECVKPDLAELGEACSASTNRCRGAICDYASETDTDLTCLALPREGEACRNGRCFPPALCDDGACVLPDATACTTSDRVGPTPALQRADPG